MGRRVVVRVPVLAFAVVAGIRINWVHFNSTSYPYTISQPSSFRHVALTNSLGEVVDTFCPALGSSTTCVSIYAVQQRTATSQSAYLRQNGGMNVRPSVSMRLAGQRVTLICADFRGLTGSYREERGAFAARGLVWYITLSYEQRYRSMRPTMLHMISTFRLRG